MVREIDEKSKLRRSMEVEGVFFFGGGGVVGKSSESLLLGKLLSSLVKGNFG